MTISADKTSTAPRRRPTSLRTVLIAALAGTVVVGAITQLEIGQLIPPLAIIMLLTAIVAGLCATPWRWAPLLAAAWALVSQMPGLGFTLANLSNPGDTQQFARTLIGLVLTGVAVAVGVAATVSERQQTAAARIRT